MGCFAEIIMVWPDGSRTECEVGSDGEPHPDLLDELVKRVIELYRATVAEAEVEDQT